MADVTLHLSIEQALALRDFLDGLPAKGKIWEAQDLVDAAIDRFIDLRDYRIEIRRTDI